MNNPQLGENLKRFRKKAGYTQEELANRTGLSKMSIRRYETGERQPSLEALDNIAKALDIDVWDLYQSYIIIPRGKDTPETQKAREEESKELEFLDEMSYFYSLLNATGQYKALEQVEMLTKIPDYQKETE